MLSCKEVSTLVSASLDEELQFWQRVQLWMHLGMCRLCSRFRKDLLYLHSATRRHAEEIEGETAELDVKLPPETRERIRQLLSKSQ